MVALGTIRSRASIEREALKDLDGMRLGNGRVSPKGGSWWQDSCSASEVAKTDCCKPHHRRCLLLDSNHGYSHDMKALWQEVEQRDMRKSQKDSASFMYAKVHQ